MPTADKRKQEAIHRLMSIEMDFIDVMHAGMQRYSRPLRHCILNPRQHFTLFQNIEKVSLSIDISWVFWIHDSVVDKMSLLQTLLKYMYLNFTVGDHFRVSSEADPWQHALILFRHRRIFYFKWGRPQLFHWHDLSIKGEYLSYSQMNCTKIWWNVVTPW